MYKVLLVDDEPIIVDGLQKVIKWNDYNCCVIGTAGSATEGISKILELKPDIIITDIKMPDNDGFYMLAAIKSQFPDVEITVLSGHSYFDYARQAINLGVCRYLLKPSKLSEIEEAVMEMKKRLDKKQIVETPKQEQEMSEDVPHSDANSFVVRIALEYIEKHYFDKITLTDVADSCYVSQWHMSKLLNKYVEKNFYQILNEIRIKNAKELLKDHTLRISDIGDMVGYTDTAHFAKVFKKLEGKSPNDYRNTVLV